MRSAISSVLQFLCIFTATTITTNDGVFNISIYCKCILMVFFLGNCDVIILDLSNLNIFTNQKIFLSIRDFIQYFCQWALSTPYPKKRFMPMFEGVHIHTTLRTLSSIVAQPFFIPCDQMRELQVTHFKYACTLLVSWYGYFYRL